MFSEYIFCYFSGHEKIHLREKGFEKTFSNVTLVYNCDMCDKKFFIHGSLINHKRKVHDGIIDKHTCDVCGKVYSHVNSLKRHLRIEHKSAGTLKCDVCGTLCGADWQLKRHMKSHQDPSHICRFCGKALKSKDSLISHERSHTGDNPYKCNYCDYVCKSSSVLCKHKLANHKQEIDDQKKSNLQT